MAYQPPDLGGLVGMQAMSPGGFTSPSASRPVSDLGEHYTGLSGPSNAMRAADGDTQKTLVLAAAIVIGALALLWLMGGLVFKSIRV